MPTADIWMLRLGLVISFVSALLFLLLPVTHLPYQFMASVYGTVISSVLAAFVLVRGAFPRLRGK